MNHLVSIALLLILAAFALSAARLRQYPDGPRAFSAAGWGALLAAALVAGAGWSPAGFGLSQMLAAAFPPLLLAGELQRAGHRLSRWFLPSFATLAWIRGVSFAVDPHLPALFALTVDAPLLVACGVVAWRGDAPALSPGARLLPLALGLLSVPRLVDAWFDWTDASALAALPLWVAVAIPTIALQIWAGLSQARRETEEAQAALAASVRRFDLIANGTLDLVSEHDAEGRFLYASPSYRAVLGWDPEALIGTDSRELFHPDDQEALAEFRMAVGECGEMAQPRLRLRHRNGSWHAHEGVTRRYWDEEGQERFFVVNRDVSDRVRFEQNAFNAQRFESLQLLARGIAHDFNNLLVPVIMSLESMRQDFPLDADQDELISGLEDGARRATELATQLLDLSGNGEEGRVPVDFSELVGEVVRLFVRTLPDGVSLHSKLSPGLPLVRGNPARLHQVVTSLLANAVEALGDTGGSIDLATGTVEIQPGAPLGLEMNAELEPGTYVYLEVCDDGPGIDDDIRDRIFDPFVSTKPAAHGLGLAVLMGTVQSLGGAVEVRSAPGRGSIFRVLLPPCPTPAQAVSGVEDPTAPRWNGRGLILLVDDEDTVRRAARRALESLGFEVIEARNGRAAIAIFRRRAREIKCVVLDSVMPELSGEQTYAEFRKIRPDTPVLLTSGRVDRALLDHVADRADVHFLPKPFTAVGLGHAIRELLEREAEPGS